MRKEGADDALCCSFCKKGQDVVGELISSPSEYPRAYICDQCLEVCWSAIVDGRRSAKLAGVSAHATLSKPAQANLKALIREVPDFPKPGINFYDITTLLKDKAGFSETSRCSLRALSEAPGRSRHRHRSARLLLCARGSPGPRALASFLCASPKSCPTPFGVSTISLSTAPTSSKFMRMRSSPARTS